MFDDIALALQDIDVIAEAWLTEGASSFSYWVNNRAVKQWGDDNPGGGFISAPIKVHGEVLGELHVSGKIYPSAQKRLQADAQFISRLLPLEKNCALLAEELVDMRDQLVSLWSLSELPRLTIDLVDLLKCLASEAAR